MDQAEARFKVRGDQRCQDLARDVAHVLREKGALDLVCIGAAAINVAMKSMIIARGLLITGGDELMFTPSFNLPKGGTCTQIVLSITLFTRT